MTDPTIAVQAAIFTALNGNVIIDGSPGRNVPVYDYVPAGAAKPYITTDSQFTTNADFLGSRKDERLVYLNVWSEYKGRAEVAEIMAAIDAILHRARLPMTTGTMVRCFVIRKRDSRDQDGETFMGQVTLRVITQH